MNKLIDKKNNIKKYRIFLPSLKHGGHEKMLFKIISEKCKDENVKIKLYLRYSAVNSDEYRLLSERVEKTNIEFCRRKFDGTIAKIMLAILDLLVLFVIAAISKRREIFIFAPGVMQSNFWHALIPKLFVRKVIVYVPMCFPAVMLNIKRPMIRDYLVRKFTKLWDEIIVINQTQYRYVKDYWRYKKKCRVLINYYDAKNVVYKQKNKSNIANSDFRLVYAGRFDWHQKGLDWLVEYIKKRNDASDCIRTILIKGEGAYECEIKKIQNLPHVSVEKWSNLRFRENDILILTSRYEGFPLVAIEAICADIPVIATRTSGLLDVLNQECLFDFGDDDQLSKTISWIIEGKNYTNACELQKRNFTNVNSYAEYILALKDF